MSIEAMKQALEALESERDKYVEWGDEDGAPEDVYEAITSLRQAIEQAEKQEPVAWLSRRYVDNFPAAGYETAQPTDYGAFPVYTTPQPQQKPEYKMNDEKLLRLALEAIERGVRDGYWNKDTVDVSTAIQKRLLQRTPQPQHEWVELTDEEIRKLAKENIYVLNAIIATNAKLKQKNGYAEEKKDE